MRRPAVLLLAVALGFAAVPAAEAQAPGKVWRLAVLTAGLPRSAAPSRALEQRLAELGYVEGRNLVIDFRTAEGQPDHLPALAAELVSRRPDVLVAASTQGGMAAKSATQTIPIVLAGVGDPVGTGIVPSLARPGGNITGVSLLNVELSGKGLQLLKEAVPAVSRVAVLWNSGNRLHREVSAATEAAAATLKVGLQLLDVRGPDDLPKAFDAITRQRADSLLVLPDAVSLAHRKPIVDTRRPPGNSRRGSGHSRSAHPRRPSPGTDTWRAAVGWRRRGASAPLLTSTRSRRASSPAAETASARKSVMAAWRRGWPRRCGPGSS